MKILLALAHYYDQTPRNNSRHGSSGHDPIRRAQAVAECIATLRQNFGRPQCLIDIARKTTVPTNHLTAGVLDIVVCTTRNKHLLDRLGLDPDSFHHHPTDCAPPVLGYECHAVLRDRLTAGYDFYCYLEDDLLIRDAWFFQKLRWFHRTFGDEALLVPNRYERGGKGIVTKAYVDGPIRDGASSPYQNVRDAPHLEANALGDVVAFHRSTNPHSGAFFLTRSQLAHWAAQPYFLDRSAAFVGPLESAATLGVMKAFRVYKPVPENAAFLEIEHAGTGFLSRIKLPPK